MAFQAAKVGGGSPDNNGGVVLQAGNIEASGSFTDLSIRGNLASVPAYGTSVVQDTAATPAYYADPHGVIKAKSTGTFAYTPAPGTNFLLRAGGDNASSINGVSTPALSGVLGIPGGATEAVINKNIKSTQVGTYATRTFNVLATPSSGNFPGLTKGTGFGLAVTYPSASGNNGVSYGTNATDDAASANRTVPGELTYMFGSVVPTRNVAYKAKDSNE